MPAHWSIDSPGPAGTSPTSFSVGGNDGSQALTLAGQPITMVSGAILSVHVIPPTPASACGVRYDNIASVSTTNDVSYHTATTSETFPLSLHDALPISDATSVSAGTPIGYTVTVSNSGPGT